MSIEIHNIKYRNENNELKTETSLLLEYYNYLVKECRKQTKGKTYDELEQGEMFDRFQNRLGYFEDKLNYTITEMLCEVTYKPHKELLTELKYNNCLYAWEYTDSPMDDLNNYVKALRKKVKGVIKIYAEHEFRKANLIRGYHYY